MDEAHGAGPSVAPEKTADSAIKSARGGTAGSKMSRLSDLLHRTSRSFALSIPVAPERERDAMTVGYLLFRIADTFEDCTHAPVSERVVGLRAFADALDDPTSAVARARLCAHAEALPERDAHYRELMASCEIVLDALLELPLAVAEIVAGHSARTALGCIEWIQRTDRDGVFRLHSMRELQAYCYTVAGIPGEMLCELFLHERPELASVAADLRARAVVFGEAMQLVNILKDAALDGDEDRVFLPANVATADVLALARRDLDTADEYVKLLGQPGVEPGVVGFHAITAGLARAALEVTEQQGSGAKMPRLRVADVFRDAGVAHQHIMGLQR